MLNRFNELPYRNAVIIVTASFLSLIFIGLCMSIYLSREPRDTDEASVIKFEYCGEDPQALCVLSFGRDGSGDAIINFHVPDKKFPDFYLIIKKAGEENRYECVRNTEIPTSVFCSGAPLSLKQTIEIDLHASSDDELLASGRFLLQAFLVSTPNVTSTNDITDEATEVVEPTSTSTEVPTVYPYP